MCTHTGGMLDHLWPNDHVSLQQVKWWCKVYQGGQAVSNWWPTVHGLMLSIPAGGYTYKKLTWQHTSIDQQPTVSWVPPQPMLGVGKPHQTPCGGIWAASLQTCTWSPSLPRWPAHSPRPPPNTWNQTRLRHGEYRANLHHGEAWRRAARTDCRHNEAIWAERL